MLELNYQKQMNSLGESDSTGLQWPPDIGKSSWKTGELKRCTLARNIRGQPRRVLNLNLISKVLILCILSSQLTVLLLGARVSSVDKFMRLELPFVKLVSADPAPEPLPGVTRTATSGAYRAPPINGSMFGKRSVGSQSSAHPDRGSYRTESQRGSAISQKDTITDIIEEFLIRNNESKYTFWLKPIGSVICDVFVTAFAHI